MSQRRKAFNELLGTVRYIRDTYKERYAKISADYKAELQKIEDNVKPGSALYQERTQTAKQKKEEALEQEKKSALVLLIDTIADLENMEKARVSVFDEGTLAKLERLSLESLTRPEVEILVNEYGNKNYWVDRKLSEIAQKSGISDLGELLEPNIDVKLRVLDELGEKTTKFIQEYTDEPTYNTLALISEREIERAREVYTNNATSALMSDFETANSAFASIMSKQNETEKAIAFSRVLQNANDNVFNMIVAKMSNSHTLSDYVVSVSGASDKVQTFRESGGVEKYAVAERLMNEAFSKKNSEEICGLLEANKENDVFYAMVESEARTTDKFKNALALANGEL